jgi:hypothetical protein
MKRIEVARNLERLRHFSNPKESCQLFPMNWCFMVFQTHLCSEFRDGFLAKSTFSISQVRSPTGGDLRPGDWMCPKCHVGELSSYWLLVKLYESEIELCYGLAMFGHVWPCLAMFGKKQKSRSKSSPDGQDFPNIRVFFLAP